MNNIKIIFIQTFHPGNIGSAVRAMKTMGISNLCLVAPKSFPHENATALAAGAQDMLKKVTVVKSLDDALYDCQLIIGTSARIRNEVSARPLLDVPDCAKKMVNAVKNNIKVALVFGQETMGMSNEDLEKCHYHAYINANPEYPVLNISAALQVFCYEIYKHQSFKNNKEDDLCDNLPTYNELENFYNHLEETLYEIRFLDEKKSNRVLNRLRNLFTRSQVNCYELNILRGILTKINKYSINKN